MYIFVIITVVAVAFGVSMISFTTGANLIDRYYKQNTAENARNTLEILKELNVASMTVITSSYHQKRGQMLYAAMAAKVAKEQGYAVKIAGNFCFEAEGDDRRLVISP